MEVCPEEFWIDWGAGQNGCKSWIQKAGQVDCVIPDQKLSPWPRAVQMLEPSPLGLSENKRDRMDWSFPLYVAIPQSIPGC